MKKLALILLLVSFAYPQNRAVKSFILRYANASYGTNLNGSQYWFAPNSSALNFGTGDFTFFALIKYTATPASGGRIFDKLTGAPFTGYVFNVTNSNYITVSYFVAGSTVSATQTTGATLNNGQVQFVAATVQRGDSLRVFVNGSRVATSVASLAGSITNTDSLIVGASLELSRSFNGIIGQAQIISGRVSDAEIEVLNSTVRRSGFRPSYSAGSVVAWYEWESAGFDKSGNSNHLSKVNDPIIVKVKQ